MMCDRQRSTVAVSRPTCWRAFGTSAAAGKITRRPPRAPVMRAVVVALIDLGRSARMRYHAQALSAHGADVDLVGFEGTPLPRAITDDPRITVHRLSASMLRHGAPGFSYAPIALVDALRMGARLWRVLRRLPKPDVVLAQDPPAFPTLTIARLALQKKGVRFVIDWHNIGYSV